MRKRGILSAIIIVLLGQALCQVGYSAKPDIAAVKKKVKEKGYTFQVGENPATQYSLEQITGLKIPKVRRPRVKTAVAPQAPAISLMFDWRALGGCTPIKNQGSCGSCWAFAAMGAVESMYLIRSGVEMDLSEQWLACNLLPRYYCAD